MTRSEPTTDQGQVAAATVSDQVAAATVSDQVAAATVSDQVAAATVSDQVAAATVSDQVAAATVSDQVAAATVSDQVAAATVSDQVAAATVSDQVAAETDVWRRIRSLVLEQHDRRTLVSVALGMSFIRVKVLLLAAVGPITMSDLADKLNTDRPYLTVMIDDLESRGLVRREPHPGDRRLKIVSITADGAAAAVIADDVVSRPPAALAGLSIADLTELTAILDRIDNAQ